MDGDNLVYPYCFKDYQILDNGPLRTTVQLTYHPVLFQGDSITEHRIISLDKGQNYNRMTVWYTGMTHKARLASGVVLHEEAPDSYVIAKDYVAYADPTDNPRVNNCQLFVATLYANVNPNPNPNANPNANLDPDGNWGITTKVLPFAYGKHVSGAVGHAVGIADDYDGNPFTYWFGSAWSKHDVRTMAEWQQRIEWTLRSLKQPLKVTLE